MTNLFYGKSIDGKLRFDNQRAVDDYLASVDKKSLIIRIDKEKSVRSYNQNRYYWFYLRLIANDSGHTEDELHQLFKRIFLPPTFITVLGREIKVPSTTKGLNKNEFSEYLDKIAAETNIPLPDPKQVTDLLEESMMYPQESNQTKL